MFGALLQTVMRDSQSIINRRPQKMGITLWNGLGGASLQRASRAVLWTVRSLLLAPLIWCTAALANTGDGAPGEFYIRLEGERLTVQAREVPQQELLEALAHRLDFDLILMGPLPQPRSFLIERRHWEQTLKQVLSPASWALHYARVAGDDRLVQVVVFPPGPHSQPGRRASDTPVEPSTSQVVDAERSESVKEDQAQPTEVLEPEGTDPSGETTQESEGHSEGDYDRSATSQ
jgi:hypothetical protein